jgi:hypothetical protein
MRYCWKHIHGNDFSKHVYYGYEKQIPTRFAERYKRRPEDRELIRIYKRLKLGGGKAYERSSD